MHELSCVEVPADKLTAAIGACVFSRLTFDAYMTLVVFCTEWYRGLERADEFLPA